MGEKKAAHPSAGSMDEDGLSSLNLGSARHITSVKTQFSHNISE